MATFMTEMRDINHCGRIIGQQAQLRAGGHGFEPFAGLENGQGAQQPQGVQRIGFISHNLQIFRLITAVHTLTTRM